MLVLSNMSVIYAHVGKRALAEASTVYVTRSQYLRQWMKVNREHIVEVSPLSSSGAHEAMVQTCV